MKTVIPLMKRGGGGSIVNISSTEGLAGTLFCGAYTASKFGVRGLTKVAAIEYGADGIRVNSVHPGGIDTPMTRAVMGEEGREYVAKHVAGLKRMGTAEEVAGVVLFLAGDDSAYCTGAEFVVDGGVTASAGF
jgi:3alpha(or 20beta)-hydroxysteroid dehydrogenase